MAFRVSKLVQLTVSLIIASPTLLAAGSVYSAEFDAMCFANAAESCYVAIEGKIDESTPVEFEKFIENYRAVEKVLLHSLGGNLNAGLRLGTIFRDRKFSTFVGRAIRDPSSSLAHFAVGECYSSCAYAFLGGSNRFLPKGSLLGFHQFFWDSQRLDKNLNEQAGLARLSQISGDSQMISGVIAAYISGMGVDGALLWAASRSDDLYFPTPSEAVELKIVTVQGFNEFGLLPVGEGVVAQSLRRHDDLYRDPYAQVLGFCWGGDPFLYFTSNKNDVTLSELSPNRRAPHQAEKAIFAFGKGISAHDMYFANHGLERSDGPYGEVTRQEVDATWWADAGNIDGSNPVTIRLSETLLTALYERRQLYFWLEVGRVAGSYFAFIDLSDRDLENLRAAYRLCVQNEKPTVSKPVAQGGVPSFDCSKAGSVTEQAICNSAEIAALDRTMAQLYAAKENFGATTADILLKPQRDWIKRRNACGADISCLRERYIEQIEFLTSFSE